MCQFLVRYSLYQSERDGCVNQGVRISQSPPISFHCLFDLRHNVRPYDAPLVIAAISFASSPTVRSILSQVSDLLGPCDTDTER
jgi:hypothetical protein